MAEEREVVRVTYRDLEEIAHRNKLAASTKAKEVDSSSKDSQKKKTKRPERSIYRPGVSRLRKVSSSQDESDCKGGEDPSDMPSPTSIKTCSEEEVVGVCTRGVQDLQLRAEEDTPSLGLDQKKSGADARGKRRRPDIQIYVPKGKLQEKDSEDVPSEIAHDDADSEFSPDPPEQSEEEVLSPAGSHRRKVNIIKAKERKMCITVVNEDLSSPKSAEPGTGFLKTMIFERGGSGLPSGDSSNVCLGDYNQGVSDSFSKETSYTSGREEKWTDKSGRGSKTVERPALDGSSMENSTELSDSQSKQCQDSPAGKSKRYSLAKRKQRNGNGSNGNGTGENDVADKYAAGKNNETDAESDLQLDEIDALAPRVLDWSEEVERELGNEDEDVLKESNIKPSSEKVRGKSRNAQRGSGKKGDSSRAANRRELSGKQTAKEIPERQHNPNVHAEKPSRGSTNRRSSFDSLTRNPRDGSRHLRGDSDAESDITDHQGKRKNRRRRERKRTRSGPGHSSKETGGLKVTVDRNERQVEVEGRNYHKRFDQDIHSSREHISSDSEFVHSPKGGGILHISMATDVHGNRGGHSHRHERSNDERQRSHEHLSSRGDKRAPRTAREGSRGGSGQRTLFDPSNPLKPIIIQSAGPKLHMKDSGQSSPHMPVPYESYGQPYPMGPPCPSYGRGYPEAQYPHYPMGNPDQYYYSYPGMFEESSHCRDDTYAKDPYYHSGYDPDYVIGGMSRSQCTAMADLILRDAGPLDCQLSNILSRRIHSDGEHLLDKLRHDLKTKYEQVILLDPDLSNKHNVEQLLWKNVYYQVIEIYRRRLGDEEDEDTRTDLLTVLDEATVFYESLLQKLQHTYSFRLDLFLDMACPAPENLSRAVKLALLSAQRTMICLGDIARYREQALGKMNYGKARSWYMKAQQIAPKNGRPYNQLAILALYTKRKLDAVYYYMRSLAASNPFLTARESLMSLFDEARKKAEATEQKRHEEKEKLRKWRRRREKEGPRIEIWISADGHSEAGQVEENYEEDLNQMTPVELNKRLSLSFLNAHGKLFTKIGMERFDEVCGLLMREFQAVLARRPTVISNNRLVQLMAMNMFAVDNTALKGERIDANCRSLLQEHAVQQGLEMFALLASQFATLLSTHIETKDYPSRLFNDDLHQLVPSIKVWSDWMLCHPTLWNPEPSVNDPETSIKIDVWKEVAEMFNVLKEVDISHVKLYKDKKEGCDPVILEEDNALAGFVPLLSAPSEPVFVHATVEKHIAKDCLRIQKLQTFADYLCGIEPPMLAYNVETRQYYSVAPSVEYSEQETESKDRDESDDDDVIIESEEEIETGEEGEHRVRELRAKKQELERRVQEQVKQKENVEAILEKHRHRAIELQVCPVFLVPDTNCFINYLTALKKLLNSKKFTLVVPLVVINELDGLTKGGLRGHPNDVAHQQHMTFVSNHAKQAVQLLENEFEKRNPHLKALTSKGSTLETISFRSEETDGSGVNDDLILSCCLHYCKDVARDFMPKSRDTPIRLQRDVVLLTDDRNLRLKAHTRNVPVKDIPSFLKWANIT